MPVWAVFVHVGLSVKAMCHMRALQIAFCCVCVCVCVLLHLQVALYTKEVQLVFLYISKYVCEGVCVLSHRRDWWKVILRAFVDFWDQPVAFFLSVSEKM